jgi:hypothetical protein
MVMKIGCKYWIDSGASSMVVLLAVFKLRVLLSEHAFLYLKLSVLDSNVGLALLDRYNICRILSYFTDAIKWLWKLCSERYSVYSTMYYLLFSL